MGPGPGGRMGMGPGGGVIGMGIGPLPRDAEMEKFQQQDMRLEQCARDLAMEYRGASKEDREKIKEQIVAIVKTQFDVRQDRRSLELKRLEEELKRLRDILDRRAKARKDLIEKRISELVGPEEPGVEFSRNWRSPPAGQETPPTSLGAFFVVTHPAAPITNGRGCYGSQRRTWRGCGMRASP